MNPIFVKPRYHYGSYDDFWKLVELSGFAVCCDDEVSWEDDQATYIFTYFSFPWQQETGWPALPEHSCKTVLWDIERWAAGKTIHPGVDQFWVSDKWYASKMPGSQFVILGTDGLDGSLEVEKKYDFSTRAYMNGRRQQIVAALTEQGASFAPNSMENKHSELLESRAMLCMHQDDLPMTEPLRFALAASYGLPILAEASEDFYPFTPGSPVILPGDFLFYWLEYPHEGYHFKSEVLNAL